MEEFSDTRRIRENTPRVSETVDSKIDWEENNEKYGILVRNISAKWNPSNQTNALKDISFAIKKGECYGICGSVGDGKV